MTLLTRQGTHEVPSLPRPEVDPTGAGDVFAAAFLVRYQETGDPLEAAAFAACAASCAVEGIGTTTLGDRDEVSAGMARREHMIETGEWEECRTRGHGCRSAVAIGSAAAPAPATMRRRHTGGGP